MNRREIINQILAEREREKPPFVIVEQTEKDGIYRELETKKEYSEAELNENFGFIIQLETD